MHAPWHMLPPPSARRTSVCRCPPLCAACACLTVLNGHISGWEKGDAVLKLTWNVLLVEVSDAEWAGHGLAGGI